MVIAMLDKLKLAKKHIEKLYLGTFSAIERVKSKNPKTGLTEFVEQTYIENQPCKLSFKTFNSTGDGVASALFLSTVLFYSPDLELKSGSKVIVQQNGKEYILKNSGVVRAGINHNECRLDEWDDWA